MKILGIDPGTATTGFGVIDVKGSDKFTLLDLGLISTSKDLPHGQRLDLIYKQISQVITKNSPDVVAIERLFFATNALTAIAVGQAIGVIKLAIFHHHLEVFDYAPMQVKLMIGGTGKADKTLMKQTIKKMFHLRERKGDKTHFDNTADALAIAVCHAKKTLFFVLLLLFGIWNLGFGISSAQATYDPLAVPNNRIGIHILDPQEVIEAAKLVNSSNGDWGYVTVPIRSNDRDIAKWEKFFEECRRLHLIPIIRISTYPVKNVWERPTSFDLVDFANFLSRFSWPTKNRYIVLFNEPNHSYEWGGQVSVIEYTNLLIDASRIFKSASTDYFLLTAGLDMSAPTNNSSLEGLSFYRQMFAYRKDWPNYVDGLSVHAYPNPGFISSIYSKSKTGVKSYEYELNLLKSYGVTSKPIFITETGTKSSQQFFPAVLTEVWTDSQIVAITPFILFANSPDFSAFSFLDANHQPKDIYYHLLHHPKTIGSPQLANPQVLESSPKPPDQIISTSSPFSRTLNHFISLLTNFFKPYPAPNLTIGTTKFAVEVADTPAKRTQGLSNRQSLKADSGMLFVFDSSATHSFWMKDMRFPLDFIWINKNQIVYFSKNVPPPTDSFNPPVVLNPPVPVDMVLEINSGLIDTYNFKIGDYVDYSR